MKKLELKKVLGLIALAVFLIIIVNKCSFHSLPKEKLSLFGIDIDERYLDSTYHLTISNPVHCPNRFFLNSQNDEVNKYLETQSPIHLKAISDTTIMIHGFGDLTGKIDIKLRLGNPKLPIRSNTIEALPYTSNKSFQLLQGNNSNPTHNSNLSRYAFDFTMSVGDTVTSVQNGYVIGVVDEYTGWGYGDKWKSYANQIMIYDTMSNLFTMYGHLKQKSCMVKVGDYVTISQPIALSGKTGQTTEEHLHFNVLKSDEGKSGIKSYPIDSIGNYKVSELKRYQSMKN